MKRILVISLLALNLTAWGTKYYVDVAGVNDAGRNGSISQPWLSWSYASTRVSAPDTIYINAGSHSETSQVTWLAGVYVTGAGKGVSVVTFTSALATGIYASSSAGTNGNQSISHITVDCDSLITFGLRIMGRSNVTLHDFEIKNSIRYGITIADQASRSVNSAPTAWATGIVMRYCDVINCGRDEWSVYTWQADGAIDISGLDRPIIEYNNIDNVTGGRYAYGIKGLYGGGYHKGTIIRYNKIRTNIRDNAGEQSFGFNIELWTGVGGIEIYGNDLNGCIDMGGYGYWDAYGYGLAFIVDRNILIQAARPTNQGESGLILESGGSGGMYFTNNYVGNFSTGMTLGCTDVSLVQGFDNVEVSYNVMFNIGMASGGTGKGIGGYNLSTGVTINNFRFLNNVVHKVNNTSGHGVSFEYSTTNTWTNSQIRNNIIYNAYTPIQFRNQIINGMLVDNNIIYGHTNSTIPDYTGSSVSNTTFNNNQVGVDPLFYSFTSFRLTPNSPAIDAGIDVGLTRDYFGNIVPAGNSPDIGIFEYMSDPAPPPVTGTTLGTGTGNDLMVDKNGMVIIINN